MFKLPRKRKPEPELGEQHTVGERIGRFVGPATRPYLGGRLVPTAPGEPTEEWERAQREAEEMDCELAFGRDREG
jgi:hypothetical protein